MDFLEPVCKENHLMNTFLVFYQRIQYQLRRSKTVHVVWDLYSTLSIKGTTREKRGHDTRQHVCGSAKVPGNWHNFLSHSDNKTELISYLSGKLMEVQMPDSKCSYVIAGENVLHVGSDNHMGECNHEEADTRIVVHALHSLQTSSVGLIHTGDTDVIVFLLSNFHHMLNVNPEAEIWVAFKAGKQRRMISINHLTATLGDTKCKAFALFHSFTGSDSTSSFKFKGKRCCLKAAETITNLQADFASLTSTPFEITTELEDAANKLVCRMYYQDESDGNVDHL